MRPANENAASVLGSVVALAKEVERLRAALGVIEDIKGNVYLWRIGEIDAEKAMEGVRDALGL